MNNIWSFVENNFPDYTGSDIIARSNDLQKIIDGDLSGDAEKIYNEEFFNTIGNVNVAREKVARELREINSIIYEIAIDAFQEKQKFTFTQSLNIDSIRDRAKGKLSKYLSIEQAEEIAKNLISEQGEAINWSTIDHYIIKKY